jgi:hypothetical protein
MMVKKKRNKKSNADDIIIRGMDTLAIDEIPLPPSNIYSEEFGAPELENIRVDDDTEDDPLPPELDTIPVVAWNDKYGAMTTVSHEELNDLSERIIGCDDSLKP